MFRNSFCAMAQLGQITVTFFAREISQINFFPTREDKYEKLRMRWEVCSTANTIRHFFRYSGKIWWSRGSKLPVGKR